MTTKWAKPGVVALMFCVVLGALAAAARAEDDYPNRPATIVVPFPPGASNDCWRATRRTC